MVDASTVQKVRLRGRDADLAAIAELIAAASSGHGGALVLTGPAGIGRTALLAAALEALPGAGSPAHPAEPTGPLEPPLAAASPGHPADPTGRTAPLVAALETPPGGGSPAHLADSTGVARPRGLADA